MIALLVAMLACSAVAITLGLSGRRRVGRWVICAEFVMVLAMLDAHLPGLDLMPSPVWAALLVACAMGTAFADRLRRARSGSRAGDPWHPAGMLLGAALVLLAGASPIGRGAAGHGHPTDIAGTAAGIAAVLVAYGAVVLWDSRRRRGRELVRGVASLGAVLTMGAMVAIG
jgi:hypothetical protein